MDSYLTFVNRGLHNEAKELVIETLETRGYEVHVQFLGEDNQEKCFQSALKEIIERNNSGTKKRHRSEALASSCCRRHVQAFRHDKEHFHVGYNAQNEMRWSLPGHTTNVWIKITTNASPLVMGTELRFLGPLVAFQYCGEMVLGETQTLDQVCEQIREMVQGSWDLTPSVNLWKRHVDECWSTLLGSQAGDCLGKVGLDLKHLTYRLSCLRTESSSQKFKRQDLLTDCATYFVNDQKGSFTEHWKVDLKEYDLELVLFMKADYVAVGVNLRPYIQLKACDYSNGRFPPDIAPPYLSGSVLSQVVRLRPATAQLLLHLAQLKPGDILLDPCVGIGTIPIEATFAPHGSQGGIVALGGDLVLTKEKLGSLAADYAKQSYQITKPNSSNPLDFLAWDACQLPFRAGIVDVVVSDLPFGSKCLSSGKLNQILPLIMSELARVLTPESGRMVLLCGAYTPILETLKTANENAAMEGQERVWKLPCQAIMPVNVGGLGAWLIQVERGEALCPSVKNYHPRMKKVVARRDLIDKSHDCNPDMKQRKLQS